MFPLGLCHGHTGLELESVVSLSHDGADPRGPGLAPSVWASGWC